MNAYLIGSSDRHVEERLHACGVRTSKHSVEELATLAAPAAPQPDLVVIDLRGHAGIPAAVASLRRQHPLTGVVIVASNLDPAMMLDAMRAGVTELVTEPVALDELKPAIDRVAAKRPKPDPGRVFAFVGSKGGIGTTTLAVNVATVFASRKPSSALLIDLHVADGDASLFLGVEPRFSVADALENVDRLDGTFLKSVVAHTKSGLDVLASAERPIIGHTDARAVRTLIDSAARHYRYIVIDVPRADAAILESLDLADPIVVVSNQELPTVRSTSRMVAALRQRYGAGRVSVVVSRYDQHAEIGRKDIERVIGGAIAEVFPSHYRMALDALNRGRPLVLDNHTKLAGSYSSFARRLEAREEPKPVSRPVPAPGLLGRLSFRT